ncbi:MAG: hypothetical protein MJE63_22105 [Proteobacteria bacterium]|nr:hypothetical protein [Pseudomonadota bacterium]
MARVEKIDKWLDSAEKAVNKKSKGKGATPVPDKRSRGKKKDSFSGFVPANELVQRIQLLLKESPDSPGFFGKKKLKVKERKRKLFRRKNYPDLTALRVDLNKLSANGKADVLNRQKVRTDLKNYPEVPDLHVINAIYTYQDIPRQDKNAFVSEMSQSKLNEAQLAQLRKAIDEIVMAFHNGGLNVFNINWFVKIYLDYLNTYKGRLTYEYAALDGRNDKQLVTLAKTIKNKQAAIISLLTVKDKLGGLSRLSRRLNGTTYLSDAFDTIEIKKAVTAVQNGEPMKTIANDRIAGKTLFVLITIMFLMARIPILKDLVESILSEMPDEDKGIQLRKRMVHTIMLTTEFEMALAGDDKEKARVAGDNLYGYCIATINNYTKSSVLKEQYEIDPYLKAIWVIKSSDGLHSQGKYKEMLAQGYKMIETLSGDQNYLKEPHREAIVDIAKKYLYQLDSIMDYHGWLGQNESQSWQNRE